MARCVWVLLDEDLYDRVKHCTEPRAKHWLFTLDDQLQEDEYVKVMVTLWALWKARRDIIHEEKYQTPFATCGFITSYIQDLKSLEEPKGSHRMVSTTGRRRGWIAPPEGRMKGNVDGAICNTRRKSTAAAIFHDQMGKFQGASVIVCEGVTEPACVEAMAYRESLCLAQDLHISSAVIACDSSTVVRSISEGC